MDYFIIAFALLFILAITFDFGMRDLFPARYKARIDSQQRKWQEMDLIEFPAVQKLLTNVFRLALFYGGFLFIVFFMRSLKNKPFWLSHLHEFYLYGLLITFLPLTVSKLYVYFKANAKSMDHLAKDQHWGFLSLYFLSMYWLIDY